MGQCYFINFIVHHGLGFRPCESSALHHTSYVDSHLYLVRWPYRMFQNRLQELSIQCEWCLRELFFGDPLKRSLILVLEAWVVVCSIPIICALLDTLYCDDSLHIQNISFPRQVVERLGVPGQTRIWHHNRCLCQYRQQKTMYQNTVAEVGCGPFDQLDLQSQNGYKFVYLAYRPQFQEFGM